jgi:hypothetical protein
MVVVGRASLDIYNFVCATLSTKKNLFLLRSHLVHLEYLYTHFCCFSFSRAFDFYSETLSSRLFFFFLLTMMLSFLVLRFFFLSTLLLTQKRVGKGAQKTKKRKKNSSHAASCCCFFANSSNAFISAIFFFISLYSCDVDRSRVRTRSKSSEREREKNRNGEKKSQGGEARECQQGELHRSIKINDARALTFP